MAQQKILRIGVLNPLNHIDPLTALDAEAMVAVRQVCEAPYTNVMGSVEIEPLLVLEVDERPSAEGPSLRFRVREDVVFSDGRPMVPKDVLTCLERAPALRRQWDVRLDGDWLEVAGRHSDRRLELALTHVHCSVVRYVGDRMLGTGPWMRDDESTADCLRLVRNPYYRSQPPIDELHFLSYSLDGDGQATNLVSALDAGEIDLSFVIPRDDVASLAGVRKWVSPSLATGSLFLNTQRPSLADPRVRRAVAHGIDRYAIAKTCYGNALAFMASSLLPRGLGAGEEDDLRFDLARAQSLRQEFGSAWPKHLSALIVWGPRPYLPRPGVVAELIAEQLERIGIEITIHVPSTSQEFFEGVTGGQYDLILGGWLADYAEPCEFLEVMLASDRVAKMDDLLLNANYANLCSEAMDLALANYRQHRDGTALRRVIEQFNADAPLVPLIYGADTTVASFRVQGIKPTPLPVFPMTSLDIVE